MDKGAKAGDVERLATIRCKSCMARFAVPYPQITVECPGCGQGWKIKWFKPGVGMIIAPLAWSEFQRKARKEGANQPSPS